MEYNEAAELGKKLAEGDTPAPKSPVETVNTVDPEQTK
jgi:hypothetical protein